MFREEAERDLLRVLDDGWADAVRRAGPHLACRPGCTACCIGPFPITPADAARLARGLDRLRRAEPARAEAVAARTRESVAAFRAAGFPGEGVSGALAEDDAAVDAFLEAHAEAACPALDPATGRCDLYDARPVSCRTFGPPVRVGEEILPPCALCFTTASAGEIEAARVAFDPQDAEAGVGPEAPETLVAFALVTGASARPPGRREIPGGGSRRRRRSSDRPRRSSGSGA